MINETDEIIRVWRIREKRQADKRKENLLKRMDEQKAKKSRPNQPNKCRNRKEYDKQEEGQGGRTSTRTERKLLSQLLSNSEPIEQAKSLAESLNERGIITTGCKNRWSHGWTMKNFETS